MSCSDRVLSLKVSGHRSASVPLSRP